MRAIIFVKYKIHAMFAELSELSSRDYNADCVAAHLSVLGEKVQYSAPEDSQLPDPGAAEADTADLSISTQD